MNVNKAKNFEGSGLQPLVESCPYPGAKPYFLISGNKWDDRAWLVNLIQISAAELPLPKKKAPPRDVAKNLGVSVRTLYRWITAAAHSQMIFKAIKNFESSGLQPLYRTTGRFRQLIGGQLERFL